MPAAWSAKDERMYDHILSSCKKRGRYGLKRCKAIAGATVNKQRRQEGRTLGLWTPAFAGLGARLSYRKRSKLRRSAFCLPSQRKYPVPDCSHARNALSRASAAYHQGYLSKSQYDRVQRCAQRAKARLC